MFPNHVTHEEYCNVVMDCLVNQNPLNECIEKVSHMGIAVEKGSEKRNRKMHCLRERASARNTLTHAGNPLDEFIFFKDPEV